MIGRAWSPEEELELINLYVQEELEVLDIAEHFDKNTIDNFNGRRLRYR